MAIKHLHQVQAGMPKELQERLDAAKKSLSEAVKKLNQMKKDGASDLAITNQKDSIDKARLRVKKAQRGQQ